ncbi:MAG: transcriptional regulator [Oscillospiraceae bacterium]|nr:transcriptional regulator [Oscillospiraceae bacterium]
MRELTFLGFLTEYVRSLSKAGTASVFALAKEASSDNPRLREPLFLYALASGKKDILLRAAKKFALEEFYAPALAAIGDNSIKTVLEENCLPQEYLKVWRSYLAKKNTFRTNDVTKELMRNKILRLQKERNVTNYRIYTDLKMNPGNLNAWLKHGDNSKISLDSARSCLMYLSNNIQK